MILASDVSKHIKVEEGTRYETYFPCKRAIIFSILALILQMESVKLFGKLDIEQGWAGTTFEGGGAQVRLSYRLDCTKAYFEYVLK